MKNLKDVLIEQLKDIYSAESQLIEALPLMAKGAESEELRKAFEDHLGETKNQLVRLKKISKIVEENFDGHTCQAMKGIVKEGSEVLAEEYEGEGLKDIMLVAAAQRVEHYEIAAYGNAISLSEYLELDEVVALLQETIEEEGNADKTLTEICQESLYEKCSCEDGETEDNDEMTSMA